MSEDHLGLDALADALAVTPRRSSPAAEHLSACVGCAARLTELREAEPDVRLALAGLPDPDLPPEVAARLDAALVALTGGDEPLVATGQSSPGASVTTLPARAGSGRARWWAAAAGLVLVIGVGAGLSAVRGPGGRQVAGTAAGSAATADPVRNDTGTDYTSREQLAAALPALLAGTAPAAPASPPQAAAAPAPQDLTTESRTAADAAPGAAGGPAGAAGPAAGYAVDPLARLRTRPGLADCLTALLPADDPAMQPLALDYGSYRGTPALVVVLPSGAADRLDVFVVGGGCSATNDSTLFYASVPAP